MPPRLAEIRTKLERLRVLDVHRRVFGAKRTGRYGHEYRELRCLDDAAIAKLEADCGVTLPEELRVFLTHVHGGGPGPGYGLHVFGSAAAAEPFPYSRADLEALLSSAGTAPSLPTVGEGNEWPPDAGFVELAEHGCGVTDVLVVTGSLRGTVWCCDMAWRPYADGARPFGFLDWYEAWLDGSLALFR